MIILTVIIACCIALLEIMMRYTYKNLFRLFSPFLFMYIGFHLLLAVSVYFLISFVFRQFSFFTSGVARALAAGLGYSFIFKSKIFDITVKNHRIPVGPVFFHKFVTGYLIRHMNDVLEDNKWKDALEISSAFPHLETYVLAMNILWRSTWKVEMDERENILNRRLKNLRNRIFSLSTTEKSHDDVLDTRVVRAAMLLIDHFGDKKKILRLLDSFVP